MKKHFTGMALFIFIVGISAFVASMFIEIPKTEVLEITETVPQYVSKKKCSKKNEIFHAEIKSIKITQAVYSVKDDNFDMNFFFKPYGTKTLDPLWYDLHFFKKNAGKALYLGTSRTMLKTDTRKEEESFDEGAMFSPDVESIKDIASRDNIYVIVERINPIYATRKDFENECCSSKLKDTPMFDKNKAVPVLIKQN